MRRVIWVIKCLNRYIILKKGEFRNNFVFVFLKKTLKRSDEMIIQIFIGVRLNNLFQFTNLFIDY